MRLTAYAILIAFTFLVACTVPQRAIQNYVVDLQDTSMGVAHYLAEPRIQKNDLLNIRIYSAALDPKVDELYNLHPGNFAQNNSQQGYLVDQSGNIELPRIGLLHAEGLSKTELAGQIKQKLAGELQDPSVIIRFTNFRVIVMGEVAAPGVKTIQEENLTVLEAIAMAGDITSVGKKAAVKVLREQGGQRRLGVIDLTSSRMFASPYYQLQQNDVVLVEATPYKTRSAEQQRITQQIGFALTVLTSIALVYNIFVK
ncbi:polysaccharide export outer membrane protein [Cnuella takakiae]|uniref:Polysaccharide export outer membrane protein n=1 Tax=Cnuella takakiae TaxID=1302690 RepID=A0A1M5DR27_9BACT|nr:polysaccharide biosynthesis/export family protein [Cnuella takakiae]OLY93901.1 hypothetical protein BUE76_19960 [Cnuella takakiae]SHF69334.1 polysaccharide export outer membrane protein [Cnuella takakiae]